MFRSFKFYWDEQVMLYWHNHGERTLTKQRFGKVFNPIWNKCMTPSNINTGFKATCLYPYDPSGIPEEAFKPSTTSNLPDPESTGPGATSTPTTSSVSGPSSPQPGMSQLASALEQVFYL